MTRWAFAVEAEALFRAVRPSRGIRVLDAGCGPGRFTSMLAAQGAAVVGLDPDRGMLAIAAGRLPGTCALGTVEHLPLRSAAVDVAVASPSWSSSPIPAPPSQNWPGSPAPVAASSSRPSTPAVPGGSGTASACARATGAQPGSSPAASCAASAPAMARPPCAAPSLLPGGSPASNPSGRPWRRRDDSPRACIGTSK